MVNWKIVYTTQARKDAKKIGKDPSLKQKVRTLLLILEEDPLKTPPMFEKLVGDLEGAYSRRINIQHRLVYQLLKDRKIIKILRMWTHYE
ncbi:toxin of toxin-antitoxin system [bacterium I07]|nr:toxin of toxin-antitoxin system [bacterium I07]